MSNKTPYELRFDVLQMARDLEMQQYEVLMNSFWVLNNEIEEKLKYLKNDFHQKDVAESLQRTLDKLIASIPTMPTSDQINRRAKELYEFVENK